MRHSNKLMKRKKGPIVLSSGQSHWLSTRRSWFKSRFCRGIFLGGELSHGIYGLGVVCNLGLRCYLSCVYCPVLSIDILLTTNSGKPTIKDLSIVCPIDVQLPRQASETGALACKSLGGISPDRREGKYARKKETKYSNYQ